MDNTDIVFEKNQFHRVRLILIISISIAFVGIIIVYMVHRFTGVPLSKLTKDPLVVTDGNFYIGALSNFGILLWSAATAICFFGAFLLSYGKRDHPFKLFLILSGTLTLIVALDDTFLIHEEALPLYFHVPQKLVMAGYVVVGIGYLVYSFKRILLTDYILLILACSFLGISMAMDQVMDQFPHSSNLETFIEDSIKFFGIVFWVAYFSRVTFVAVYESVSTIGDPDDR
ncbi:MAG: hypothetical protein GY941_25465 [Planctomycetes bacterium]|nr:hypothetical protein [Planctomycetota bacterium]